MYVFDTHADAAYLTPLFHTLWLLDLNDESSYEYVVSDIQLVKVTPSGMSQYKTGVKLIKSNSIFMSRGPR